MNGIYDGALKFAMSESPEDNFEETAAFFRDRLKRPVSERLVTQLLAIQTEFRKYQIGLVQMLVDGAISREDYLTEFNAALRTSMDQRREVMGEKDFMLAYGEAGLHPEGLIDPEIFLGGNVDDNFGPERR